MTKHLTVFLFIGTVFWSCEDNEDAPSIIGEWEFISNYRSGGMGSDTLYADEYIYQSLVFSDSGTFAYEGKRVYTATDFNWKGNWTKDMTRIYLEIENVISSEEGYEYEVQDNILSIKWPYDGWENEGGINQHNYIKNR